MNFAIIGCGMIANIHAAALQAIPDASLVGAFSAVREEAVRFTERYNCNLFETQEELLRCPEVDAVCICTPSGYHAEIAVEAMKYDKHVVVEKPMAITLEQTQTILKAAEQYHKKICVISQMRTARSVNFLKSVIEKGYLGRILFANLSMPYYRAPSYYQKSNWKGTWKLDGGGALMNQGIHGIDLLLHFCGQPASVYGIAKTMVHAIETEDTAGALIEFQNGAIATVQATTSVPPGHPRILEICGERGSFAMEEVDIIRWEVPGVDLPDELHGPTNQLNTSNDPTKLHASGHQKQIEDFIQAVKEDRLPLSNQYEGKKAVEMICSIYRSSQQKLPVRLQ